jgi:O-antigen/teichoic acid export membrane protein
MGVSLYTVRVVLDTIGTIDYGIYNVVGGIVTMFGFLSGTMATASQRFFAFELGRNNQEQLKKTFSTTLLIYILLGLFILILAETLGLWFLNHKMTIPPQRMTAARWIYQFTIFSFLVTMLRTPYNASIIAHERMNIFAIGSIVEVLLKLLIVYLLVIFHFDKLKLYGVLMFAVTIIVALIYMGYSIRKFKECKFSLFWDAKLSKEIIGYSGWNLFGAVASLFNKQGINIILNLFFGPIVNAARGIAFQISSTINQFVQNFMMATNPQIIKYYAANEKQQMLKLVTQSAKLSYLLLFIVSMPILLETKYLFTIWLKEIPEYVILFGRLIILGTLIDSLSLPLMTAIQATGKIKKYQTIVGGIMILNLPIAYVFLYYQYPPETVFILTIINSIICLGARLILIHNIVGLSIKVFLTSVITPLILVSTTAYIAPLFIINIMEENFIRLIAVGATCLISSLFTIYFLGLSKQEKQFLLQTISKLKNKRHDK